MQFDIFIQSLEAAIPPANVSVYLQAMWYDARGDWHTAHGKIDHLEDAIACWVHAYLHRKEGDIWNADYWYRRAEKTRPTFTLQQEWENIVKSLL